MIPRGASAILDAPIAFASDGTMLVNATHLGRGERNIDDVVGYAKATGLPVFVGVAVPARLRKRFVREIDDASADVVGRLGPKLTASGERASASSRSAGAPRRGRRGPRAGQALHQQGRRP